MRGTISGGVRCLALGIVLSTASAQTMEACLTSLRSILTYPGNVSAPYLNAATGHFDLAYSYQSQMLSVFPNKVIGQYDMCQHPQLYSLGDMPTTYCALSVNRAGICVPAQCTEDILSEFTKNRPFIVGLATLSGEATMRVPPICAFDPYLTPFCASAFAPKEYFESLYQNLLLFSTGGVSCGGGPQKADDGSRMMIAITAITFILGAIGMVWGISLESDFFRTNAIISPRIPVIGQPYEPTAEVKVPFLFDIFDLRKNTAEIFNLHVRAGEFSCFDGIRALSCWWVIAYHVILWQHHFISNPEALLPPHGILARWWSMPLFNFSGTLCVDTFLFISAFLAAYLLLCKLKKEERPVGQWLPMLYLNRFLRITPAYMFSLFLNWKLAPLISFGPFSKTIWANNNENCPTQWWRHLLYINTVSPWMFKGRTCFGHTWYLADDMMYFLTVPFLVMLYQRGSQGRILAYVSTLAIIWACVIYCLIEAAKNHWSPNIWDGDEATAFHDQAFELPWTRAPSYYIGIVFAFIWYDRKQSGPKQSFKPLTLIFLLFGGLTLLALTMYGPATGSEGVTACVIVTQNCGSDWTRTAKVMTAGLARPAWTLGLALMCLVCWNGQGGWINSFLSAPIWSPFSFLSYTVYLTHFTVLTYYTATRTARIRWEFFDFCVTCIGLTIYSHILGLLVSLLIEKPCMKLQKAYLEAAPAKKKLAAGEPQKIEMATKAQVVKN